MARPKKIKVTERTPDKQQEISASKQGSSPVIRGKRRRRSGASPSSKKIQNESAKKKKLTSQAKTTEKISGSVDDKEQSKANNKPTDDLKSGSRAKPKVLPVDENPLSSQESRSNKSTPKKKRVNRRLVSDFESQERGVNEDCNSDSDSSEPEVNPKETKSIETDDNGAEEGDDIEMEVSFANSDFNHTDFEYSSDEDKDQQSDSSSESESEERDLNRRIAISKIGSKSGKSGHASKNYQKEELTYKNPEFQDGSDSFKSWMSGIVSELKELRGMAVKQAESGREKSKKKKKDKDRSRDHFKKDKKKDKGKLEDRKRLINDVQFKESTSPLVKSPSDTIIYAPGLTKNTKPLSKAQHQINLVDQISDFVERIRVNDEQVRRDRGYRDRGHRERSSRTRSRSRSRSRSRYSTRSPSQDRESRRSYSPPVGDAAREILNAELNKAEISAPPGKSTNVNRVPMVDHSVSDRDGDFFSIGCHIESPLKHKIQRGEFVELAKLLMKIRQSIKGPDEETKIEIVSRNGATFLQQGQEKEPKITGFRSWEEAFRVYAQIYSEANPHRGAEVWQYIHNISSAANSFLWDNVAYYDFIFRKLMAQKPQRCWGTIHTQLWSVAMRDHVNKGNNYGQGDSRGGSSSSSSVKKGSGELRDICCWRYNKNRCKHTAQRCRYEHRCSFCGSYHHIYLNCPRRPGARSGDSNRDSRDRGDRRDSKDKDSSKKNHSGSSNNKN